MSILFITPDFPPRGGGMSERARQLVDIWQDKEKVIVLTDVKGKISDKYERIYIPLKGHYVRKSIKLSKKIKEIVKERSITKIFCLSWSPPAIAVLLSGAYKKRKWAVTVNGFDIIDGVKNFRTRFLLKKIFKRCNNIFSPSLYLRDKILTLGDFSDKISAISNGVQLDRFKNPDRAGVREKYNLKDNTVIMSLCRLHPIKGIDTLIKSFTDLKNDSDKIKLLIAGDGPQRKELEKLASDEGVREEVIFTGWIRQDEVADYYAACDIFAQPNRKYKGFEEGQGITLMEASAAGRPVISTRTGGIGEVVDDNETGFLVKPESEEELTGRIKRLIENPGLREKMGKKGKEKALKEFDGIKNGKLIYRELSSQRVLYIDEPLDPPGGGQKSLKIIIDNIDKGKFTPFLFEAGKYSKNRYFSLWENLSECINKTGCSIIHCNAGTSKVSFISALLAKLKGIHFIWHARVSESSKLRERIIGRLADKIIIISDSVGKRFKKKSVRKKVVKIYNAVDTEKFKPGTPSEALYKELKRDKDKFSIGIFSRLVPMKGHRLFLDTASKLIKDGFASYFLIAGDGEEEYTAELKNYAKSLNLEERVRFLGYIDNSEEIMNACDIILHTSIEPEAFGRTIVEAMACGKPVVATDLGGPVEIIDYGTNGFLCEADAAAMAQKTKKIIDNKDLRRNLSLNAREKVVKEFSIPNHIEKICKLYEEVKSNKKYGQ